MNLTGKREQELLSELFYWADRFGPSDGTKFFLDGTTPEAAEKQFAKTHATALADISFQRGCSPGRSKAFLVQRFQREAGPMLERLRQCRHEAGMRAALASRREEQP